MELEITPVQRDILQSLVEMTLDGTDLTFGDWLECNPQHAVDLEVLDGLLRAAGATCTEASGS